MGNRLARARRVLLGDEPRALLWLAAPTGLSIAVDLVLRGKDFLIFEPHGKAIYFSSLLVSSAFWMLPLLWASRLSVASGARMRWTRRAIVLLFFVGWVLPIAAASYGGQVLYFHIFRTYIGRDTLRLGALLRGSYRAWLLGWSSAGGVALMVASGLAVALALYGITSRVGPRLSGRFPLLPVLTFPGALFCFWSDNIDSRYLQAATPDVCFLHSAVHALRAATTGVGRVRQGVTLRTPAPLPPLVRERPRPRNVLLIVTESVRADTLCSDPPPACRAQFLDAKGVAADRISLGKLTAQTPNTFSACLVLWTGLAPNSDFEDAHTAPLLWEIARAVGYRTAYVTSQNAKYEDFGVFLQDAGIDVRLASTELGGMEHEQLGAPDERATEAMLGFLLTVPSGTPFFAVLQLSNTHHPYRVDPALTPFTPQSDDPLAVAAYFNRYRNSVLMQERLVAGFLHEVRSLPSWDDTVVVFVSDHGEPFAEHGIVHHNHSVFDEELRIPGWLVAGSRALSGGELASLRSYAGSRTYAQDVNATIVDLLGVARARETLPLHDRVPGRSLLRPRDAAAEPTVLLATSTGVWEPYDPWFGVMRQENVLVGSPTSAWACFDMTRDPKETSPLPATACPALLETATRAFPGIGGSSR
jgi:hypothetical protein